MSPGVQAIGGPSEEELGLPGGPWMASEGPELGLQYSGEEGIQEGPPRISQCRDRKARVL